MSLYRHCSESPMHKLIHVFRYSGQQLNKQESVSDHVWQMISLSLTLVPKLNLMGLNAYKINLKEVIYRCVVHDLDESLSLDIPRYYKYHNESLHQAIEDTNEQLMRVNYDSNIVEDILSAKDCSKPEGLLVKIFDSVQAGMKMKNEVQIGNSLIKSEIWNVCEVLEGLKTKVIHNEVLCSEQVDELGIFIEDCIADLQKYAQI